MDVEASEALMIKVGEMMDGTSTFDILAIFSWILGNVIVQTKADPRLIMAELEIMTRTAVETMSMPEGMTLN